MIQLKVSENVKEIQKKIKDCNQSARFANSFYILCEVFIHKPCSEMVKIAYKKSETKQKTKTDEINDKMTKQQD